MIVDSEAIDILLTKVVVNIWSIVRSMHSVCNCILGMIDSLHCVGMRGEKL
jgi:hypothetical protein